MKPKTNYIPPDQFQLLLDNVDKLNTRKMQPEDIVILFKLARYCGLRISEACRIKAEDIDLEQKEVYLGKTKTNKNDKATIPLAFIKELTKYLKDKKGSLFKTNRFTVNDWLTKLGKMLNIAALTTPQSETGEKTKCHIFRKSIGKDMIYQKIPLNVIMSKLRHRDLGTTTQYLKLNLEDVKAAEANLTLG